MKLTDALWFCTFPHSTFVANFLSGTQHSQSGVFTCVCGYRIACLGDVKYGGLVCVLEFRACFHLKQRETFVGSSSN
jgi:hypothetical protein